MVPFSFAHKSMWKRGRERGETPEEQAKPADGDAGRGGWRPHGGQKKADQRDDHEHEMYSEHLLEASKAGIGC